MSTQKLLARITELEAELSYAREIASEHIRQGSLADARIAELVALVARVPQAMEDAVTLAMANYRGVDLPNRIDLNTSIEKVRRDCTVISEKAE